MMYPPPPTDDVIRIVSIDPGTDTLGVAVLDISIDTYRPVLVYADTFIASKEVQDRKWGTEMRGGRDLRLESHHIRLYDLFRAVTPTLVAAESPFLARGRVSAFEALVECYAMLRAVCWEYSPSLYLRRVDPITAKNAVNVNHVGTDKTDVRRAVIAHYKESCAEDVDIEALDEHAIDAVAVGHSIHRKYLLNESFSMKRPASAKKTKRRRKKRKGS